MPNGALLQTGARFGRLATGAGILKASWFILPIALEDTKVDKKLRMN